MEGLNGLPPEYLIAICEFTYASRSGKRYLPNEVRRFFVGTMQQTGEDKRHGLPERIAERFGSRLLVPLFFSLIKHPIKIGERLANAAIGAIAVYRTSVVDEDAFTRLCNAVNEEWQKRFSNIKEIKGFRIIAGYGVSDEY
jgi:hypothetical protein